MAATTAPKRPMVETQMLHQKVFVRSSRGRATKVSLFSEIIQFDIRWFENITSVQIFPAAQNCVQNATFSYPKLAMTPPLYFPRCPQHIPFSSKDITLFRTQTFFCTVYVH